MNTSSLNPGQQNLQNQPEHAPSAIKLDCEQLIIEVIAILQPNGLQQLPVYENDSQLGMVSLTEILRFLHHEPEKNLLAHKLCYTLKSLISMTNRTELFLPRGKRNST